ncbi:MAG: EAL domain-containing protein [Thermoclostridium sp.]|nr:EAL domain-containing protein [Thermoclostridium sp.]
MDKILKMRRNVPSVLKAIDASNDEKQIELYENILTALFASPVLVVGIITHIIIRNLLWHQPIQDTLYSSIFYLSIAALFELVTRVQIKPRHMTHFVSILINLWFLYTIDHFFINVTPAVLTMGFIQIILALSRTNRIMLYYVGASLIISGINLRIFHFGKSVLMNQAYFTVQFGLFFVLFIAAAIVMKTNENRFLKERKMFLEAMHQKEEILSLYEEVSATEEELRGQNEQLKEYNEQMYEKEVKLNYISYFDPLTGLPNREMILVRLQSMLRLNQKKNPVYIVFFDVDNFKHINDTQGYRAGDELLNKVTEILNRSMAEEDLAGRLGGDEFALLIQRPMDENSAFRFIDQIRRCISEIEISEAPNISPSASFGVSVYPFDGEEEIELMRCADTAMFKAKEKGRNNIQFYRGDMKEEILRKIELEKQLAEAVKNVEFLLYFQPQFSLDDSNSIRGFEALIRWKSSRGIISPMDFIPLAEKSGLIIPIGKWVMLTACQMFQELCAHYDLDALISVNISAVQMRDKGFVQLVKDVLRETQMEPYRLEFEITESMLIESPKETVELLKELKTLGIHISLDDFGTGYSSLNYLKMLPIDTLKIDKAFVDDIAAEAYSKNLLGDMIHMAHHLNLSVIAEGVETEEQLEFLKATGCDYAQGYLLSRPKEMSSIQELLAKRKEGTKQAEQGIA